MLIHRTGRPGHKSVVFVWDTIAAAHERRDIYYIDEGNSHKKLEFLKKIDKKWNKRCCMLYQVKATYILIYVMLHARTLFNSRRKAGATS